MVFGSDPKDDEDFDFLWQSYVNAPLDAERRFIMKAFSRVKDKKKLQMQVSVILLSFTWIRGQSEML